MVALRLLAAGTRQLAPPQGGGPLSAPVSLHRVKKGEDAGEPTKQSDSALRGVGAASVRLTTLPPGYRRPARSYLSHRTADRSGGGRVARTAPLAAPVEKGCIPRLESA